MSEDIAKRDEPFGGMMGHARVWTSMPLDTVESRRLLSAAMLPLAPKLDTVINMTIRICNIVLQPVEDEDEETGEIGEYLGVTLICMDGSMYWTGSRGVRKSLQCISLWSGPPPWKNGVLVKVIQNAFTRKNGQPGRSYYLEPVFDEPKKSK